MSNKINVLATFFFKYVYFNATLNPSMIADIFDNLVENKLNLLANQTGFSVNEITYFFNTTVPCIRNVTTNNVGASQATLFDHIWLDCFYYIQPTTAPSLCKRNDVTAAVFLVMVLISGWFLIIVTCCCRKRIRFRLGCCYGYPGPVVPLNMLDSYENRKGYALIFGLTVNRCMSVLLGSYSEIFGDIKAKEIATYPSYIAFFIKVQCTILICIMVYPFFICQGMQNRLVGSVIGFLYTTFWIALEVFKLWLLVASCWIEEKKQGVSGIGVLNVFINLPLYICLILLDVKFLYTIYKTRQCRKQRQCQSKSMMDEDDADWKTEYMYTHVKNLLKIVSPKDDHVDDFAYEQLTMKEQLRIKVKAKLYECKPDFKYSTRMVASMVVVLIAVYICAFILAQGGYYIFYGGIWELFITRDTIQVIVVSTKMPEKLVKLYLSAFEVSYWMAIVTACISVCIIMMNSLTWYRRHIMSLRKGNKSFLPNSVKKKVVTSGDLMNASMKFAGFQVGYAVWGFFITAAVVFLAYLIIITELILPLVHHQNSLLIILLIKLWPTMLIAIIVMLVQRAVAKYCFLVDQDSIAVDNRRAFHITSYFLFYYNIFLGLVSCLLRILFGVISGVLFLQRLQKSTLPRSYEKRDPGYAAYMGYLMLEHQHSNPVLQCFVRLLLELQEKKIVNDFYAPGQSSVKIRSTLEHRNRRMQNKWHLFVMLSQNPSLKKYRAKEKIYKPTLAFLGRNLKFNFGGIEEFVVTEELESQLSESDHLNCDAKTLTSSMGSNKVSLEHQANGSSYTDVDKELSKKDISIENEIIQDRFEQSDCQITIL